MIWDIEVAGVASQSSLKPVSGTPPLAPDDIVLVACLRNEKLRIEWFLDYHRALGINHFLVIDNASTDGTAEYLEKLDDVTVFSTDEKFSENAYGTKWVNQVLDTYAVGHWTLVADVDELFVYTGCERHALPVLTAYLDFVGAEAMSAHMLDMYPEGPIKDARYMPGTPFLTTCPYFDGDSYGFIVSKSFGGRNVLRGGPRQRLFWDGRGFEVDAPLLYKIPLVKWRIGLAYDASTHRLPGARLCQSNGILLHFKFLQDFPDRAELEAQRKEHYDSGVEYAAYANGFADDPKLVAYYDGSVAYKDSYQLVERGLMEAPPGFMTEQLRPVENGPGRVMSDFKNLLRNVKLAVFKRARV